MNQPSFVVTKFTNPSGEIVFRASGWPLKEELNALTKPIPKGPVSRFTPGLFMPYRERGKPSLKTYNNLRGLLSTLFKFAFQKDWVVTNPIEKSMW